MKNIKTFESFTESLGSGSTDAYIYPLKKGDNPEKLLSSKPKGSFVAEKAVSDLLDVFGNEISIYRGDEVITYLQVNSKDFGAEIYKIKRRELRGWRTVGYVPNFYRDFDQTEEVYSSAR